MAATTYQYVAWSADGKKQEGTRQSASEDSLIDWLKTQNLTPISIDVINEKAAKAARAVKQKKSVRYKQVKSGDLSTFCWQLSTMIEGGMPIAQALETIGEEMDNPYFGHCLTKMAREIEQGETLTDSVKNYPKVFNELAQSMMMAAETGGSLPETLNRLADYYANRDKMVRKVKSALSYPIFVVCFIVVIIVAMFAFVIPNFQTMFDTLGGELPAFTRNFMNFYHAVTDNVFWIVGGVAAFFTGLFITSKTKSGYRFLCKVMLKVPLFGRIIVQSFIAMFCKTFSTLIDAGVPVLDALDILRSMTKNELLQDAITKTRDMIVEGSNISEAMASSKFFPNISVKMTQIGEESGSLPSVLDKTAEYYEIKVEALIGTVLGLIEPVLIVTVGGIVLTVILAMYMPIFTMGKTPH